MFEPKKVFELVPEGIYDARLIWILDLGTHQDIFDGVTRYKRSLYLGWELIGTAMTDGRPFMVGKEYTITNGKYGPYIAKTSNLFKLLRAWQKWDEKQAGRVSSLGGLLAVMAPASISVAHEPNKKDATKTNVILEMIKAAKKDPAPAVNLPMSYEVGEDFPEHLPDWVKKKVQTCCENTGGIPKTEAQEDEPGEPPVGERHTDPYQLPDDMTDNDIPF
jgi:hypothetical protein